MSTVDAVQQSLRSALSNLTPACVISQGYEGVFHEFFSKGTTDEIQILLSPPVQHSVDSSQSPAPPQLNTCQSLRTTPPVSNSLIPTNVNLPVTTQSPSEKATTFHNVFSSEYAHRQAHQPFPKNVLDAIEALKSTTVDVEEFKSFLESRTSCYSAAQDCIDRYAKLQEIHAQSEKYEFFERCLQRITLLLMAYIIDYITEKFNGSGKRGVSARSLAIREVAKRLDKSIKDIKNYCSRSRHYASILKAKGFGALAMLGDNKKLWEDKLKDDELALVLEYVDHPKRPEDQTGLKAWKEHCNNLNLLMTSVAREVLDRCGWDMETVPLDIKKHLASIQPAIPGNLACGSLSHFESTKRSADDAGCDDHSLASKRRQTTILNGASDVPTYYDPEDENYFQRPSPNIADCICLTPSCCVCHIIPFDNPPLVGFSDWGMDNWDLQGFQDVFFQPMSGSF